MQLCRCQKDASRFGPFEGNGSRVEAMPGCVEIKAIESKSLVRIATLGCRRTRRKDCAVLARMSETSWTGISLQAVDGAA